MPVVTAQDDLSGRELVVTLAAAGITAVEVTMRTEAGLAVLEAAHDVDVMLGAGTVTSVAMAKDVIRAGARFVVSPGLDADVVRHCQHANIPVVPGVATPTELMRARSLGLRLVKVFPAEQLGGVAFVRAVSVLWPDQTFMPTGGVTARNASDYLSLDSVVAVGGSWMVPADAVSDRDWPAIRELARVAAGVRGVAK